MGLPLSLIGLLSYRVLTRFGLIGLYYKCSKDICSGVCPSFIYALNISLSSLSSKPSNSSIALLRSALKPSSSDSCCISFCTSFLAALFTGFFNTFVATFFNASGFAAVPSPNCSRTSAMSTSTCTICEPPSFRSENMFGINKPPSLMIAVYCT